MFEDGDSVPEGVEEDGLDLQLVLVVGVPLGEVAELLGQVEAVVDVLRGDKVLGHFPTKNFGQNPAKHFRHLPAVNFGKNHVIQACILKYLCIVFHIIKAAKDIR